MINNLEGELAMMTPQGLVGRLLIQSMDAQRDAGSRANGTGTDIVPEKKIDMEQRLGWHVLRQNRALVVPELIGLIEEKLPRPGNATAHEVQRMAIGEAIGSMLTDSAQYHNQAGFYAFWKAIELMLFFGFISEAQIEKLAQRKTQNA